MILEYLFLEDKKFQEDIIKHRKESLDVIIKDVKKSNFWIVVFRVNGENKENALILSKINKDVIKNYNVITLVNESAFYYNKKLYPLINEFERKLRKILYLASKLSNESSDSETIHDIEEMDFGKLFELLFTDDEFIQNVKETRIKI